MYYFELINKMRIGSIVHYKFSHPCENWEFGIRHEEDLLEGEDPIVYIMVDGKQYNVKSESLRKIINWILENETGGTLQGA